MRASSTLGLRARAFSRAWLAFILGVLLAATSVSPAAAAVVTFRPWTEVVSNGYGHAVTSDPSGHLHMVLNRWTTTGIWYATNASGAWVVTRIRNNDVWGSPSIASDGAGKLYVAYTGGSSDPGIHYLTNRSGTWRDVRLTTEPVDTQPSIAVDPLGEVHITYDRSGSSVHYLTNRRGFWIGRQISPGPGESSAIALDANRRVHVAYTALDGVHYVSNASGAWIDEHLADGYAYRPAIALRGSFPRIAFMIRGNAPQGVFYATKAASWTISTVVSGPMYYEGGLSLGLDAGGKANLTYTSPLVDGVSGLSFATNASGAWVSAVIGRGLGWSTIFVREGAAREFVAASSTSIFHRSTSAPTWSAQTIFAANDDLQPDITVGADGVARLTYAWPFGNTPGLRFATLEGTTWTRTRITTVPDREPAIAVGPDGSSHLAFLRSDAPDELWYGTNGSGSWVFTKLDTTDNLACPAIAVSSTGHVFIAASHMASVEGFIYFRVGFYTNRSGSWVSDLTAPYVAAPGCPDVAADSTDRAHLAYEVTSNVYYVHDISGSWSIARIIAGPTSGNPHLVLDGNNKVYISFARDGVYDSPAAGLYLLTNVTGAWTSSRIARTINAPLGHDLAIDAAGHLHAAFPGWIWERGLHSATNASGSWVVTLLNGEDVGQPTIGATPDGHVRIAYGATGQVGYPRLVQGLATLQN